MNNILFAKEYDSNGNLRYIRYPSGIESWYDLKGNFLTKEEYDEFYGIHS